MSGLMRFALLASTLLVGNAVALPFAQPSELDARSKVTCPGSNNADFTASSGSQFVIECGADHPGNMKMVYSPNMDSCVDACDNTDGCVAVSWVALIHACYMKNSVLPASTNPAVWGAVLQSSSGSSGSSGSSPTTSSSPAPASTTAQSSSPTATAVTASSSTGKRGLAFNAAPLTDAFAGHSKISWAYNWGHDTVFPGILSGLEYVPMLWGTNSVGNWVNDAKMAINAGTKHLLAFNEPDLSSQSNLSPGAAASAYQTYMMPFSSSNYPDVRLGAPAVTNGGSPMGLTWLSNFMSDCSGCQIDFVPIHWYDSATNIAYFQNYLTQAHAQTGKPIWITEFGFTSGSDQDIVNFFDQMLPWMDQQDWIERYAYFMCTNGLLLNGNSLSTTGTAYATI